MPKFWDLFRDHRTPEQRAEVHKSNKLSRKESPPSPRPIPRKENSDGGKDASAKRREQSKDMLGMMEDLSISPKSGGGFVGGFQSRPSPSPAGPSSSYAPPPAFPEPFVSPPSPGPLPTPPQIVMPTPQTYAPYAPGSEPSLTMQYATGMRLDAGSSVPQAAYSPPPAVPARPISAPGGARHSRPRLEMDVNAVPTPPVSPRMNRASSEPPTPVSAGAKARKGRRASDAASDSSSDVETCAAITKAGKRCKNKVKTPAALDVIAPSPGAPVVRFCGVHQKEVVSSVSGFYSKKAGMTDQWVKFDVYIPENLQSDTKAALRVEMEKARSASDVEGYIYAFEIRDPDAPDVFHIKVGRAVNLTKRIDQWSKQCGSKEQTLRGWWPGLVDPSETSLLKGRVVAGEKGANCHRLERLIHIELADLVLHQPHYNTANDDSDEESKTKKSKKARLVTPRGPCADCGTVHKEIFSFQRPKGGKYVGKEWEKLVKPVIERWGEFVELYV